MASAPLTARRGATLILGCLSLWQAPLVYHYDGSGACGTTKWVGRERYLWVDLTAGGPATAYGPASAGDGGVGEHRMPKVPNTALAGEAAAEGARQAAARRTVTCRHHRLCRIAASRAA